MGEKEEGVTYPREVAPPWGLPPGWKAIERAYTPNSKSFGKTYIRYDSPDRKHKAVTSVKLCVQKDAEDKGEDADKAVKEFEKAVEDMKAAKLKEKEDAGFLTGEKREQAVEAFRQQYGPLDGATACNLPGWRAESIYREACNQTGVTYFSPEGKSYGATRGASFLQAHGAERHAPEEAEPGKAPFRCIAARVVWTGEGYGLKLGNAFLAVGTLKSIEAFFGVRVLAGKEVPEVDAARAKVTVDEKGRPINEARREINFSRNLDGEVKVQKRPRLAFDEEEYHASSLLVASTRNGLPGKRLEALGLPANDREHLERSAEAVRKQLLSRHFEERDAGPGLVLAAVGCPLGHRFAELIGGLFYQLPEAWNDRPCYQRVFVSPGGTLACHGVYLFWSPNRSCWKIGPLNDSRVGFAFCTDDRPEPTELEASWKIYTPP